MKLNRQQKRNIVNWWNLRYDYFRFRKDGSVEAKRGLKGAWGLLLTPERTEQHLRLEGLLPEKVGK